MVMNTSALSYDAWSRATEAHCALIERGNTLVMVHECGAPDEFITYIGTERA